MPELAFPPQILGFRFAASVRSILAIFGEADELKNWVAESKIGVCSTC
jgi:hypothetical protein